MSSINNNVNFNGYKITILGKNNKQQPYLFNKVSAYLKDNGKSKGITTLFEVGKPNRITMDVASEKRANEITKDLRKLDINV